MKLPAIWIITIAYIQLAIAVYIDNSVYKDFVVEISDSVPVKECFSILTKLEKVLPPASQLLFDALEGRTYIDTAIIMIPKSWPQTCLPSNAKLFTSRGEASDITITGRHPIYGDAIWTQQYGGCGESGDQIYASYSALNRETAAKELVREWAKYRYGVFDEIGYPNDPIYPICYKTDTMQTNSDWKINDDGFCKTDQDGSKNTTADEATNVFKFCDQGSHNRYAPTKQNQLCNGQSTLEVILKHKDFKITRPPFTHKITDIVYKQRRLTRYVLVIEETTDAKIRESWTFLRMAIRKWVVSDLPQNTEVGIVLANGSGTSTFNISSLNNALNREATASFIPFAPSMHQSPHCMECAIKEGLSMLKRRHENHDSANSVILVIAPGIDLKTDPLKLATELNKEKTKLVTINYPGVIRRQALETLSAAVMPISSYTVYERKQNSEKTLLTTYFELCNVFRDVTVSHYEGNKFNLPMEIHRKELHDIPDDDSAVKKMSRKIISTFMLDEAMGKPSNFYVYTHSYENPLIQGIQLISPSGANFSLRIDEGLSLRIMSLLTDIQETGTWTYTIDRINGNPQPHFVQVIASAKSVTSPVISARTWATNKIDSIGALILYVEVKRGSLPVSSALVEAIVHRPDRQCNSTSPCQEKYRLLDSGSGDPDVLKGDGIYTRYLHVTGGGIGAYKIDIIVTDNGNTAYSLPQNFMMNNSKCCGSSITIPSKQTLPPFQRYLPSLTVFVPRDRIQQLQRQTVGRIGDLQAENTDATKVRLSWTSPDIGGLNVARYELKYAHSVPDIVDNFDTAAVPWNHDQPLTFSIGDETTMTMDLNDEPSLIGSTIYVALRSFTELSKDAIPGPVSNFVRIHITTPVKPSEAVPNGQTDLIDNTADHVNQPDNSSSKISSVNWQLLVPVIGGIVSTLCFILLVCLICALKRRRQKKHENSSKSRNADVTTVGYKVNSILKNAGDTSESEHQRIDDSDYRNIPDPHTIGLPIYGSDEEDNKRRLSFVVDSSHQLIEQPNQMQRTMYHQSGVSVITANNNSLARLQDSWTASQLLHEHERRHSPYQDNMSRNELGHLVGDHSDQVSMNFQIFDHSSLTSAPPVPPLPYQTVSPYPLHSYDNEPRQMEQPPAYIASLNQRFTQQQFNTSLQGSTNSVNSGERKKTRNITMV